MDIPTAKTFLAAAGSGSFLAAAQKVHASAPTVTERIKQLEHTLGVRLFDRDRRGCRLTAAGRRLIEPAEAFVRAWEEGCARVALPPRFESVLRVGGQHALWPTMLIPWLQAARVQFPEMAFRAAAAAPAHLNRAIAENELDLAFLYDPAPSEGLQIEEVTSDRLILVTADASRPWRENFVRIQWSERANADLAARLGLLPAPGLELDLGALSLDWLVETGASGFVPERLSLPYLTDKRLVRVKRSTTIGFSPYVCWRTNVNRALIDRLLSLAREGATALDHNPRPKPGSNPVGS